MAIFAEVKGRPEYGVSLEGKLISDIIIITNLKNSVLYYKVNRYQFDYQLCHLLAEWPYHSQVLQFP